MFVFWNLHWWSMVPGRWPTLVRACLSTQPLARGTGPLDTVRVLVWCCLQTRRKINLNGCFYCSISGMERMLWHLLHVQSLKLCWRHQMETFSALLAICAGWRRALMFSLICAWINGWVNIGEAGELRRHRAHYHVIVMLFRITARISSLISS